ncbi:MAG TPA: hypothetical protein VGR84_05420 [Candidatus Acidoferrales bacterium]|nr:hypothetical protein [Candidatus Acidoferrales bacterium]
MELPDAAAAMYSTWWSFANYAANAKTEDGGWAFSVADASAAASQISKTVGGQYASWNPIGLSQLFSRARTIGNATNSLTAAEGVAGIDQSMVAEAPWSRAAAEQAVSPMWQARVEMTYVDPAGVEQKGISVVNISQVLPSSVASLQAQMELRVADQLTAPPGTGTPRTGALVSVDSITLLAV